MTETATEYACRQEGTDADLMEEIRDVLTRVTRPLSMGEIAARCALADGRDSLLRPLRQMREAGEVTLGPAERKDGKRVYQLADDSRRAVAADDAPADDAQASQPPDDIAPAGAADPADIDGCLRARVRTSVRAAATEMTAPFTAADIAGACGEDSRRVSKALWDLARIGELSRRKISGNRYAYFYPWQDVTDPPAEPPDVTDPPAEPPDVTDPPAEPPGRDTAARRQGLARYAYRSDGTLLIETAGGEACELDREETDRLYLYLTAIHRGLRASMTGSVTHG